MNITLFGGSFNPPHIGHQIVIDQALNLIPKIDQLWLLPDYQHSFAKNNTLASPKHRLNMAKLLLKPTVRLQTCCFDQKMSGNTIDHINYLKKAFPQHHFSFLLGSDNLAQFHLWPQYQQLLKLMVFYIYPRHGYNFKPLYAGMTPLTHPQQIITNISSTMIRQRIKQGLIIEHLVPPKIFAYLSYHCLYGLTTPA